MAGIQTAQLDQIVQVAGIQMDDVYRVLLCYCNISNQILNVKYNQVYSFNGLSICIIASGCEPTIYFLYIFKVYV